VLESGEAVASASADLLSRAAGEKPEIVLALPTGRTPLPFYSIVASRHSRREIDLTSAFGFNLDELVLPPQDPRSFRSFMERHVWGRTGLKRDRCQIPDTTQLDLEAECRRYEAAIAERGGIDLSLLGIGADGHVAYNMPGTVVQKTHVVRLPDGLSASLGLPPEAWPLRAITMGLGTILASRRLIVLATGEPKAQAVRALVHGGEDPRWPCSFLTSHPSLEVFVDAGAASAL